MIAIKPSSIIIFVISLLMQDILSMYKGHFHLILCILDHWKGKSMSHCKNYPSVTAC